MSESLVLSPLTEHTATVIFIHVSCFHSELTSPICTAAGIGPIEHHLEGPGAEASRTESSKCQMGISPIVRKKSRSSVISHMNTSYSFDRPVTFSAGQLRPSWFDIHTLPPGDHEWDAKGIEESKDFIERVIDAEVAGSGISLKRIVLAGFSQGACLSMITALTGGPSTHELGGLVSLSGWIPAQLRKKLRAEQRVSANLMMCRGVGSIDRRLRTRLGTGVFLSSGAMGRRTTRFHWRMARRALHSCMRWRTMLEFAR